MASFFKCVEFLYGTKLSLLFLIMPLIFASFQFTWTHFQYLHKYGFLDVDIRIWLSESFAGLIIWLPFASSFATYNFYFYNDCWEIIMSKFSLVLTGKNELYDDDNLAHELAMLSYSTFSLRENAIQINESFLHNKVSQLETCHN